MKFIQVGYGNLVLADRIVGITSVDSSPVKRAIREARKRGMVIDATQGKKTRSAIFMDSNHIVVSIYKPLNFINKLGLGEVEENEDGEV